MSIRTTADGAPPARSSSSATACATHPPAERPTRTYGSSPAQARTAAACAATETARSAGSRSPGRNPGFGRTATGRRPWRAGPKRAYSCGPESALTAGKQIRRGLRPPVARVTAAGRAPGAPVSSNTSRKRAATVSSTMPSHALPRAHAVRKSAGTESSAPLRTAGAAASSCRRGETTLPAEPAGRGAAGPDSAAARPGGTGASPGQCSARWPATPRGVGWSNRRVAGRRRPLSVASRLRSSTAARESSPSSDRARSGSTAAGSEPWPRTRAPRSPGAAAVSSRRTEASSSSPGPVGEAATRRAGTRPGRRVSGAPGGAAAPEGARRAATRAASGPSTAVSKRARPSSVRSGTKPDRVIRRRSAFRRPAVIPPLCSHGPHAREVPGSPSNRRRRASASRNALAAA